LNNSPLVGALQGSNGDLNKEVKMQIVSKYKSFVMGKGKDYLLRCSNGVGIPDEKVMKTHDIGEKYFRESKQYGKSFAFIEDAPESWLSPATRLQAAALEAEKVYGVPVTGMKAQIIADTLDEIKTLLRILDVSKEDLEQKNISPYEFFMKERKKIRESAGKKIDPDAQRLQALRDEARGLKITAASSMKEETLIARIEEKKKELEDNKV
jgi:hypothetical protein